MTGGVKIVQMGAVHAPFFRTVTVTVSEIFVTVVFKSLADNTRMVVWSSLYSFMRKRGREGVDSTEAWTDVETEAESEDTWSLLHEGSWGWQWHPYQKYVLSLDDGTKMQDTRDIYIAILEAVRTTRRCVRSARHDTCSANDGDKRGSSKDFSSRTITERDSERIEDQTVYLPVRRKTF